MIEAASRTAHLPMQHGNLFSTLASALVAASHARNDLKRGLVVWQDTLVGVVSINPHVHFTSGHQRSWQVIFQWAGGRGGGGLTARVHWASAAGIRTSKHACMSGMPNPCWTCVDEEVCSPVPLLIEMLTQPSQQRPTYSRFATGTWRHS
jgi:hypothetical protein